MITPDNKQPIRSPSQQQQSASSVGRDSASVDSPGEVSKPKGPPSTNTAFRDVLNKKKESKNGLLSSGQGQGLKGAEEEEEAVAINPSIFELQGKKELKVKGKTQKQEGDAAAASQGLFGADIDKPKSTKAYDETTENPSAYLAALPDTKTGGGKNFEFSQEQPDISYVNPFGMMDKAAAVETKGTQNQPVLQQLHAVVDQILDNMYTLELNGQKDTVFTMKHPPMFAGVDVVISSFQSARGEFNIAFHNLTQAAQQLLSAEANQGVLRHALEEKGYLVHIVVITTNPIENRLTTDNSQFNREGREDQQRGDDNQQGQKQQQQKR